MKTNQVVTEVVTENVRAENVAPREELYNQSTEQLCELLKISEKEYKQYAFSKEQLVEFLLTPKD